MFNSKDGANEATDTIISAAVKVEGDLVSDGNIVVDGKVSGSIITKANLIVGEKASISASIKAVNAKISGKVKGNLEVVEKLELTSTSKIDGDVIAKILIMSEGAQLNGKLQMFQLEKVENPILAIKNNKKISPAV